MPDTSLAKRAPKIAVTKLVYIGGYGHSGSTLLEYLLTACPELVACGEVASVVREHWRNGKCTCERRVKDCPVWAPVFARSESLPGMTHEGLTRFLISEDGGAHACLVDSSKTAWRSLAAPFRLGRGLGDGFQLLHVVRDPRAVSWSTVSKAGRRGQQPRGLLRCLFAAFGWSIANLACEAFAWRHPERYLRLTYEQLARSPRETMGDLIAKLVPGSAWRPEKLGAYDNRHQLYGNRLRSERLSLAEVKEDVAWTRDMPGNHRRLVSLITAPLRRRYGYT